MARNLVPAIHDIVETVERVQTRMVGVTFAEFQENWEVGFAVQRAIEIFSEASRRIPDELKGLQPTMQWRRIAGIGNVLRRDYHTISDKVIWDVVHADLPPRKTRDRSHCQSS